MATEQIIAQMPRPGAYQAFTPEVDGFLVVQLPGESMRCPVVKVISQDAVLVKIDNVPMTKGHQFRPDDTVGVRRRVRNGRDVWEAQNDREFLAEQQRMTEAVKPKARLRATPEPVKAKIEKPAAKPVVKKKGRAK